uniref:Uncharacterized protein n=1 Tax=Rangifer tarandus platyrhynchus TaxID=3082113 RepID=A0ACB0ES81_RANTA|nr:unnamed protein product [Rangifer tarandus platyrhynchus]
MQAPCECSLGTWFRLEPHLHARENDLNPNWLSPGATKDAVGTRGPRPVFRLRRPSPPQSSQDGDGDAPGLRGSSKVTAQPLPPPSPSPRI